MDSLQCRLNRYVYKCVLCVYVYVIVMHVSICYVECMMCLFTKKCFRLVLHHVGGLGFHKTRLGIIKTCLKWEKHAHGRGSGRSCLWYTGNQPCHLIMPVIHGVMGTAWWSCPWSVAVTIAVDHIPTSHSRDHNFIKRFPAVLFSASQPRIIYVA